jgi:hypothetical protein
MVCYLKETHIKVRNKYWISVKGWGKIYQDNGPPKQAGVTILTLDNVI